jgi:hypothetical protein
MWIIMLTKWIDLSYQYKYVEKNNRRQGNPWSIRQTGVYHSYSASSDSNLFILLHPNEESRLQKRVEATLTTPSAMIPLHQSPLKLHLLVLSTYFSNWRWYLQDLGDVFSKMEDKAMTIDIRERAHYDLSFDTLQNLRHLEEKVIPLGALFRATLEIVGVIGRADETFRRRGDGDERAERGDKGDRSEGRLRDCLEGYNGQCRGHITSEEILQKRIRGILELVCQLYSYECGLEMLC